MQRTRGGFRPRLSWKTTFPKLHGTALFPEIARVQHLGYTGIALGLRRFFQSALSLDSASENRDSTEIARDRAVATCVAAQISTGNKPP